MNGANVAATLVFLTWQASADWREIVVADEFKVSPLDSQRQRARCRPARCGARPGCGRIPAGTGLLCPLCARTGSVVAVWARERPPAAVTRAALAAQGGCGGPGARAWPVQVEPARLAVVARGDGLLRTTILR